MNVIERNKKNVNWRKNWKDLKTEYEQALANKNQEVSLEIERIKKHMEEQMRKERAEATKASETSVTSYNVRVTRG